jgi:predicted nucleic acid-binding protein
LKVFALDVPSSKRAGVIAHALDSIGKGIDPEDAMIAGIALQNREEILTRNTKHFSRVPDLRVTTY